MKRHDFSRKPNSYAPILVNDTYSNFRFSKRATEVLSPLNQKALGLGARMALRKASASLAKMGSDFGGS